MGTRRKRQVEEHVQSTVHRQWGGDCLWGSGGGRGQGREMGAIVGVPVTEQQFKKELYIKIHVQGITGLVI